MSENSKIEWTDHTFNPWIGCTKVSPGCEHCYADAQDKFRKWTPEGWGKGKPRKRTSEANWRMPLRWDREYHELNTTIELSDHRPRVFCASLADWLDDEVPIEWLADLLKLIHDTPHLDWLLLTKRPENWKRRLNRCFLDIIHPQAQSDFYDWFVAWTSRDIAPRNVWIGTTVEDQKRADQRVLQLLQIPARVRFLSCEPLLGPVDLNGLPDPKGDPSWDATALHGLRECVFGAVVSREEIPRVDWVICGGESGPGARPMQAEWARSLRDDCHKAGVPFFFKQWGEHDANGERVGKKAAGRLLDGRDWNEFPATAVAASV